MVLQYRRFCSGAEAQPSSVCEKEEERKWKRMEKRRERRQESREKQLAKTECRLCCSARLCFGQQHNQVVSGTSEELNWKLHNNDPSATFSAQMYPGDFRRAPSTKRGAPRLTAPDKGAYTMGTSGTLSP